MRPNKIKRLKEELERLEKGSYVSAQDLRYLRILELRKILNKKGDGE